MTLRQLTFAENVARGKSNRDAALAAGYSARSASCLGSQLVKQAEVAKRIEELRSAGAFAAPPAVTPELILQRLTAGFEFSHYNAEARFPKALG
jgi:phage terminase small subunit